MITLTREEIIGRAIFRAHMTRFLFHYGSCVVLKENVFVVCLKSSSPVIILILFFFILKYKMVCCGSTFSNDSLDVTTRL